MKRLILLSWFCIAIGCALLILALAGQISYLMYGLGNLLLILPNSLWIFTANRLASISLGKPMSRVINVLVAVHLLVFIFAFVGLSFMFGSTILSENISLSGLIQASLVAAFFAGFTSLIAAAILVSQRVVDTEDQPHIGRGSRVAVLTICFFYIIIGMFFIAPRFKKLERH